MKNLTSLCCLFLLSFLSVSYAQNPSYTRQKTLELLDAYCPDGSRIVRMMLEDIPDFHSSDFSAWITGEASEQTCVNAINTVVHEECHSVNTVMARKVLKDRFKEWSDVFYEYEYYYLKDKRFILIKPTSTFPSKELIEAIPESLRTYRFSYIDADSLQSTQVQGIYGLVDEMNSYTQGTQASFDLLPYYEKKGQAADWHDFFQGVNGTYYGSLEFKFFILKYLMFAKDHHPNVYKGVMNNKNFITAFLEVDKNATDLFQAYFSAKPAIFERLRGYGWKIVEDGDMLYINSKGRNVGHTNFMDVYSVLAEELNRPEYRSMMLTLSQRVKGWDTESIYSRIEKEMRSPGSSGEEKEEDTGKEPADDVPDEKPDTDKPSSTSPIPSEGLADFSDSEDVEGFPFVDLKYASLEKGNEGLKVRMEFVDLGDLLVFNQRNVEDNNLEYDWAVVFDIDGDGTDEYSLGFSKYKTPGAKPVRGHIVENTQISLWKLQENDASLVEAEVTGEQKGNALLVTVSPCSFVSKIRKNTHIQFRTFYSDGRNSQGDRMPD